MMRHWIIALLHCALAITFMVAGDVYAQRKVIDDLKTEKALTQYVHRIWDAEDGLPQASVNAIAQTNDGYIWLGTQEGLVRFDGVQFKVFDKSSVDILRSNDIRVLSVGPRGVLWIGTRDAGLMRYREGVFSANESESPLNSARITSIVSSEVHGHIWVGTAEQGVWTLKNGVATKVSEIDAKKITVLIENEAGELWIGTRDMGLLYFLDGQVKSFSSTNELDVDDITSLAFDLEEKALWVGTREEGIRRLVGDSVQHYTVDTGLPSNKILSLFVDPEGVLWIGTDQDGLVRFHPPSHNSFNSINLKQKLITSTYNSRDGLSNDVIKSLFLDRENNLWIGTDGGGLNQLRHGKFRTYSAQEGLVDDFIFSIHEDVTGTVWFSSEEGVSALKENTLRTLTREDGLAADFVTSIASTPDSSVWFGTYGGGLTRYSNGVFTQYTTNEGLPDDDIFALYTNSEGVLWIGTGGGAAEFRADSFRTYTTEQGLSSNLVTVMKEDKKGNVWIGTYNGGLNVITDDKVIPFTVEDGLSNESVLSIYVDNENVLWVGTYGGGLNRIEDGLVTVYSMKQGLFNDNVVHIMEDDSGHLWMSCNRGLFRVSKAELNAYARGEQDRVTSFVFDKSDGLKSQEFNGGVQPAGWKSKDGRMWFPSNRGVASIDPNKILNNDTPPPIVLESVVIDGKAIDLKEELRIKPGIHKIEMHYAGLSFVASEKTTYLYKLDGVDDEWVHAGTRRTAYYTNLHPGSYTFRVKARNSDGVESEEAVSFTFSQAPYFYQTIWFYLIAGILVAVGSFLVYKHRMASIKAREKELQRLVEDRTRVLEKRTVDLLEALEQNKEIMGITSHDLKNPLGGIIGLADMLLEDLGELQEMPAIEEGLENVELLKSEAERMLRIIKDLLDKHREGDQGIIKKETVDVLELANDVLRWNTQKAQDKNITITFSNAGEQVVYADPDALLRVIDNLVSNAVKYSPPGKRVWVTLAEVYGELLFQVLDEGPGLTPEDLTKVFGKMQRLSAKPTAGEHSTGLGLYIVKQLIEEHGGEVGVESVYGEGATFWFKLPLHSPRDAREADASLEEVVGY